MDRIPVLLALALLPPRRWPWPATSPGIAWHDISPPGGRRRRFPGFKEVRMVEARPGIAFVEFDSDMQSGQAMAGLQNFKINPTNAMLITYAKQ